MSTATVNTHSHGNSNNTTSSASTTTATTATATISTAAAMNSPSTANTNLYQFFCIVSVCIICYYNSAQCGLVFDDISAIRDNKDLRPSTPLYNVFRNDFWGTPMRKEQSHKSYRPLTVLTFRWNYWVHELHPFGYHFVNVALHIIVCLLFRRVCRLLLLRCASVGLIQNNNNNNTSKRANAATTSATFAANVGVEQVEQYSPISAQNSCSFIAALLFAVHPIHTEAVTGIVGRAELLSSICFLAAFLTYAHAVQQSSIRRHRTHWSTLVCVFSTCLLASMLCKEQGITIAGICVAYELFVVQQIRPMDLWHFFKQLFEERKLGTAAFAASPKNSTANVTQSKSTLMSSYCLLTLLKRLGFLIFITIALLFGRLYVMGSQLPVFTRFDNPASAADTPSRQLTFSYLIYLNSWLLLFPCDLCCDWTMGEFRILLR